VLGLGTALIPIGAVAAGGIAALTGAVATAGIGIGLFGAVAITTFKGTREALKLLAGAQEDYNKATTDAERDAALEKTKTILEGLDPATRGMVVAVQDFQKAWRDFSMQFQPTIFQIAQEGLAGLAGLLPSLAPIVEGAAGAFLSLEKSAIRALQGPFWQSFFAMIGSNVGPILNQLGRSIGNIVEGFAALIGAFMPLSRDFSKGLLDMTESFSEWAKNLSKSQGFKDFVSYVKENVPLVFDLIGSITTAFVALVRAGAPLGEALIIIASSMFDLFTAFQNAHPEGALMVIAMLGLLAVSLKLIGPLLVILRVFSVVGSVLLTALSGLGGIAAVFGITTTAFLVLIGIVVAVVGAFVYAYKHFEWFRDLVNTVARAVADFAVKVYDSVVTWLGQAAEWLTSTFGPLIATAMDFAVTQFNKIKEWIDVNGPVFIAAWDNIRIVLGVIWDQIVMTVTGAIDVLTVIWNATWPIFIAVLKGAWTIIKAVISGALDIIMGFLLVWGGILAGDWSAIWRGIVQILKGVWTIITGVVSAGFGVLKALERSFHAALIAAWNALWAGVSGGLRAAWGTLSGIMSGMWGALKAATSGFVHGVQGMIDGFWSAVIGVFRAGGRNLLAGLRITWSDMRSAASTALNGLVSLVTGLGGRFFNAGASIMRNLASGIRSAIGDAVGAVQGAIGSITDLLPGSPAKTGPLSGSGYSMIRGQHFSEDLAAGISGRAGLVESATRDIADLMMLGTNSGAAFDAIARGARPGQGGGGAATISIAPGAVVLQIGDGVSPAEARQAFDGAGDQLANVLLTALRRQ
jgi:hypothetical protein